MSAGVLFGVPTLCYQYLLQGQIIAQGVVEISKIWTLASAGPYLDPKKISTRDYPYTCFPEAVCDTDHSLVVTRIKISPKRIHSAKRPGMKRLNVRQTKVLEKIESFAEFVQSETSKWYAKASLEAEWESVKHLFTVSAAKLLKTKLQDWFAQSIVNL